MAQAEEVVDRMLDIRERRSVIKKEFEAKDKALREMYTKGENWLLKHMQETGHTSFKVAGKNPGTVFTKTNHRYSFGDWPNFAKWMVEHGEIDLLQHRVAATNMDAFLKASGELPPGVKQDPVISVNIRKA